jgi:hypothetical protein
MTYASYLIGLGALGALDDVELDLIAFFEALVAFALYGCVVNEYVGALIATEETVPFCIVKPLHCSPVLCHVPNSLLFVVEVRRSKSTPLNSL